MLEYVIIQSFQVVINVIWSKLIFTLILDLSFLQLKWIIDILN
jgi:hypothetical protein